MRKRIWSALLAVAMLLTLCPLSALSAEDRAIEPEIVDETHSGIGSIEDIILLSDLPSFFGIKSGATYTESYYDQLDNSSKAVYDAILNSNLGTEGPSKDKLSIDLSGVPNGEKKFTNVVVTVTKKDTSSISIEYGGDAGYYLDSTVSAALGALLFDHPELSWLVNTAFTYGISSDFNVSNEDWKQMAVRDTKTYKDVDIVFTEIQYGMNDSGYMNATTAPTEIVTESNRLQADTGNLSDIKQAIKNATDDIGTLEGKSKYEKVKVLYEWICNHMEYAHYREGTTGYNADEAAKFNKGWRGYQTAYSALVENVTVCAGYAKAFKLLCDEYDIPCAIITGDAGGEGMPQSWGAHAWNYVKMEDGKWYGVDCTWGDQSTWIDYNYLLVGSAKFSSTRAEGTLYSKYAFAYPTLNTEDYTDSSAPSAIEIILPEAEITSSKEKPGFKVPVITKLGETAIKDVALSATVTGGSGQQVEWVLSSSDKDITLVPGENNTATLKIPSYALADKFASGSANSYTGPVITVTARCSTTQAQKEIWIAIGGQTPTFVKILKDQAAVEADSITQGGSADYSAEVYDQYGRKMTGQTVTWSVKDAPADVTVDQNGKVTVAETATAGDYTITAASGSGSASVTVTVPQAGHTHTWSTTWEKNNTDHWHICTKCSAIDESSKTAHTSDQGTETQAPTCTQAGEKTFSCTVCQQVIKTEPIDPTPSETTYTVTFNANGGSVTPESAATKADGTLDSLPTPTRSGYTFNGWYTAASGGTQVTASTVFSSSTTVYAHWTASSTGGSSGGSSTGGGSTGGSAVTTPPVTTETAKENGASTTETTATPTASTSGNTATSNVTSSVGDEIVKQAAKQNSENVVIAPEIKGNVTRTEVSITATTVKQIGSGTNADLTVSTPVADVTIPNSALSGLSSSGGTVKVTAEQTGNTVELSVTAGGRTVDKIPGGVTLTVPAEAATPGTVAVLVHEDGTREVIRKSVAGGESVIIPLDGSAKVEIVDNSKRFDDVSETSWEAGAVAFASAHELFNGTSSTTFSPNLSMSRGMLAVVLYNLENNPNQVLTAGFNDVDNSKWYAGGISWAAEQGIISGYGDGKFGPDDNITREQLAVMLWRYAGSPAATSSRLGYADADRTSSWAMEAMLWATEKGIINGKGDGILDPTGTATRAQTAQMLKNFLEKQ